MAMVEWETAQAATEQVRCVGCCFCSAASRGRVVVRTDRRPHDNYVVPVPVLSSALRASAVYLLDATIGV